MPKTSNGNSRRQIDKARAALVGIIPDPKGQVEQITTALVYKFLDKLDSDSVAIGGRRTYFVDNTAEFSWENLLDASLTGDQRLLLYRRAVEGMAESDKLGAVFGKMMRGASSPFQNARVLQTFLHAIDELDCEHTENLGDAYEHLLSIMGTQKKAGQFRTPRNIIDFIVSIVAPKKNERVLDPACGSAGFLVAAHAHVMRHGGAMSPSDLNNLAKNIIGHDIDPGMVRLAMVNLYLHTIKKPQVREYDSLSDDSLWEERYDVILANPPFMTPRGGIQPHGRFMGNARRSEVLFVDYIAQHLRQQGRAGIVVPDGRMFELKGAYGDMRKMLVCQWGLWAIVSLPAGVFNPYSGKKTSVLFLDKKRRECKHVLFVKVENDGFDLGATRAPIGKNDLPTALQILRDYNDEKSVKHPLASVVAKTKIAKGGNYFFVADNYRKVAAVNCKYPMMLVEEAIQPIKQRGGIPKSKWKEIGEYPVVDQSMNFIAGYWDNPNDVIRVSTPMIAFGLHTRRLKYVNFDFVLGAQGVKLLLPKPEFNPAFFYFACKNLDIKDLGYAIHWKELKKLSIPCPPMAVQERTVAKIEAKQQKAKEYRALADTMEQEITHIITRIWEDKP